MNSDRFWIATVLVTVATMVFSTPVMPQPVVDPKMLREGGDCLSDEILLWEQLRAERRVAVAGDDGAPVVSRDGAGKIYLIGGSGYLRSSVDDGVSFSPPDEIVVARRRVTDVQALGVLKSGKLVLAYGEDGRVRLARSEDGGLTWQPSGDLRAAGYDRIAADGVRIAQRADGTALLAAAAWKGEGSGDAEGLLYASSDEGKTWSVTGKLGPRCVGANLLQLKSGELLAAITYQGARREGDPDGGFARDELYNNVVVARSSDGGKTWRDHQWVTRYKESPGDLTELSDGTVVLTYGQQNFPYGSRAMVSRDGGRNWSSRIYILGFSTVWAEWYAGAMHSTRPGWRVSSVPLKGDTILTLYTRGSKLLTKELMVFPRVTSWYAKEGTPGEKGKAVLSVKWTLEGMRKPPLTYPGIIGKLNPEGYLENARRLIRPEHLNEGGDYFHQDEILAYERLAAERHWIAPVGDQPFLCLDSAGQPAVHIPAQNQTFRSRDQGRTWHMTTNLVPPGAALLGFLREGVTLAANQIRIHQKPDGTYETAVQVFRSTDEGKSWSEPSLIEAPGSFDRVGVGARICQLPDGTVLLGSAAWSSRAEGVLTSGLGEDFSPVNLVYRSRDGGKSWGKWTYGSCGDLLALRSGRILSAGRFDRPPVADDVILWNSIPGIQYRIRYLLKNMMLSVSEDKGYTWSQPRTATRFFECPGDLVEMQDGTVVLAYHQKNEPSGSRAVISRDQGRTWDSKVYMLGWWENSGGLATSVLLSNGKVLTINRTGVSTPGRTLVATIWQPVETR
ncbi:MAG: exo-alpha-sialidase [Acidimicrobiia bacterium]|nr:exo-alpha-sialidase [Acidimicrobiia bacterium]